MEGLAPVLLAIAGLTRAGSLVFWKAHAAQDAPPPQAEPDEPPHDPAPTSAALALTATAALVAGMVALTVFALLSAAALWFVLTRVPETSGRSLEEIDLGRSADGGGLPKGCRLHILVLL